MTRIRGTTTLAIVLIRFLAPVVALVVLSGCSPSPSASHRAAPPSRTCTEIGCGPTWILDFSRKGQWPLGKVRVELRLDGEAFTCRTEIPLDCTVIPACGPRGGVSLIETGCASGTPAHRISGVQFERLAPTEVSVEVYQNEELLGADTFAPDYRRARPNGPGCEPVCKMAASGALALEPGLGDPSDLP